MDIVYKDSKTSLYIFIFEFTLLGPNNFSVNFHSNARFMYTTSNFISMKDHVHDEHSGLKTALKMARLI